MKFADLLKTQAKKKISSGLKTATAQSLRTRLSPRHPYHSVSVIPGPKSCPQAKVARSARLLSRKAPLLPLPGCTLSDQCDCRFRKYGDRRQDQRRGFGMSTTRAWYAGEERRVPKRGRRRSDW